MLAAALSLVLFSLLLAPAAPVTAAPSAGEAAAGGRIGRAGSEVEVIRTLENASETSALVRVLIYCFAAFFLAGLVVDACFLWRVLLRRFPRPPLRIRVEWGIWDVFKAVVVFLLAVVALRSLSPVIRYFSGATDVSLTVVFQFLAEIVTLCFLFQLLPGGVKWTMGELKLTGEGLGRRVFTGVAAYAGFLPVLLALNVATEEIAKRAGFTLETQEQIGFFFADLSVPAFLFLVVFVAVMGPVLEEIFFRGFAYRALRGRMRRWPSILLTALLFSALHGSVTVFLPILGLGVLLSYVYEMSGSLVTPITVHICQNSLAVAGALLVRLYA